MRNLDCGSVVRVLLKRLLQLFFLVPLILTQVFSCAPSGETDLRTRCVDIIHEGLQSPSETIRCDAIFFVTGLHLSDSAITTKVSEIAATDRSEVVRSSAIYSLAKLEDKSDIPKIKEALQHHGPQAYLVNIAAMVALYNLGANESLGGLGRFLTSRDPKEAIEAARAAGTVKDGDQIVRMLKARLDTADKSLKYTLIDSLAALGVEIPRADIQDLLLDNDFAAKWTALNIIERSKDTSFETNLEQLVSSDNPLLSIRSAELLTTLDDASAKSAILKYLSSRNTSHPKANEKDAEFLAIKALGGIGDESDLSLLEDILRHGDARPRMASAAAIIQILDRGF